MEPIETLEPARDLSADGLDNEDFVLDELLIEEISIDGMCGVY